MMEDIQVGKNFFRPFSGNLHVEGIGTKIDIVTPRNGTPFGINMDFLKIFLLLPEGKYPLADKGGKIDFSFCPIGEFNPYSVPG